MGMMAVNKNFSSDKSKSNSNNATSSPGINLSTFTKRGVIQKPQIQFKDKINNSILPFVPKIREKPNALRVLPGNLR